MNRTYNLHRLNGFYTLNTKTVFEFSGLKKYYSTGAIEKDNFEYVSYKSRPTRANLQPEEGCLIFAKMSNTAKTIYIDNELKENIYSTGFFSIRPKNINYEYLFYLLECTEFLQEKDSYSNGTTQFSINENNLKKIKVHLTTFKDEQTRIVKAIKAKEEKINALITNEEKQIEKLKAYKQALISEVVTKGLDPNVSMKDSGVDWIGKIPFSWSVIRLKQLFNIYSGSTPRSNESLFYDGDIVWVTPADYKTDDVFVLDSKRKITAAGLKSCNLTIVENGSLIISKRAPIGTVAMAGTNLCTNQGCLSCTPKNMLINTKFYYYVLSVVGRELDILGSGTTFKEISYTNFGNFNIPYPSYRIQNLICAYLDSISNNITSLIEKHINKISLLRKYRQSMIYEYVTGKRKVY